MKNLTADLLQLAGGLLILALLAALRRRGAGVRTLLAVSLAAALPMAKYLFSITEPWNKFEDFREAYWVAGRAVLSGPDKLRPLIEQGVDGFVNFPIIAYLFAPLGALPVGIAAHVHFALGALSVLLAWALLARMYALYPLERAVLLYAMLTFGPLIYSLREGNTSHILLAVWVWAVLLVRKRRDVLAGVVLGTLGFIKLPMLLIGVYFALRRRVRLLVAFWATVGCLCLLSLAVFGWQLHLQWYQGCIRPYGRNPLPAFNAQSIASLFSRLELGAAHLRDWKPHALGLGSRIGLGLTTLSVFVAPLMAAWRAHRRAPTPEVAAQTVELELWLTAILSCLVSSLAWSHYYAWLIPAAAYLMAHTRSGGPEDRRLRTWLALGWLAAQPAVLLDGALPAAFGLFVRSHLLFGALVIYACLVQMRARIQPVEAVESIPAAYPRVPERRAAGADGAVAVDDPR